MRTLITGATGFVGPHLARACTEMGDEVVMPGDENHGFDVTDRDAVMNTIRTGKPETVFHLAALSHVGASWADPTQCLRVNVEGTANVLDACRAHDVRRVLVVGSAEEYGRVDHEEPITEDTPLRPLTPYGASKVGASYVALQAWIGGGLETIRTRTFSHTGPGQPPRFVVPALAQRVATAEASGADTIAVGNLDPVRDFADVRDIVRAYRLLMEHGEPGEVYNIGRGAGVAVADIAGRLVAQAERPLRIDVDPALVRPVDVPWLVADVTKFRAAVDWQPRYSLDETLNAVLAEARAAVQGS